ncbi:MAG TPA: EAL domain-containing protein [Burkholderiaceae bacterium]|jgi:diguanylate cyclase (GGDEF)-like protein|nr:EAL domain-containing protein [Burkholderiaceae bacterium]
MLTRSVSARNALVVDDGPVERLAGKSMLEKLGFDVTPAASGEEALDLLSESTYDLILCDISMPGMGGLELLDATRTHQPPQLFIMSTTHNDADHVVASLRRGAYGYLTKPLSFESLRMTVNEALAKYADQQSSAMQAEQVARQDALTELINKDEFTRQLKQRLHASSTSPDCGAMLLVKIPGLSHINQSYGRINGDKILQFAAATLKELVRHTDLLARFSGDVFAIFLDGVAHDMVEQRSAAITERLESVKTVVDGDAINLTVVVGGARVHASMEVADLLNRADFALHLARERSRNRIKIYSDADEIHKAELSAQLNTLALVHAVLENPSRLVMHYQPIVHLTDGKVSHYEALLRLTDENGKLCNAGELVKTCEVFGLVGRLDHAVVKACLESVHKLPSDAGVAINLSGKSIGDLHLLSFIETQISRMRIDPSRLIFELTETAAFYNLDEVRYFVSRIKNLGCRFALDDFGVGFSSFYYIKELEFDYLKIDGSFIANLPRNRNDQVFVRAMVEISRVFGLHVIAEWVEDRETADLLREYGVDYGQGYHFGMPGPLPSVQTGSV